MKQNPITFCYNKAKQYYKEGDLDKTRDYLDMGLVKCAMITKNIIEDLDEEEFERISYEQLHEGVICEGVSLAKWKMRFWVKLENWNLIQ